MKEYILNAFDLVNVSFRTEAGNERVQKAFEYAQGLFEELKVHGSNLTRDRLLAILLLGITDDLLQQKNTGTLTTENLLNLLKEIDEAIPNTELSNVLHVSPSTDLSDIPDIPSENDTVTVSRIPDIFGMPDESAILNVPNTPDTSSDTLGILHDSATPDVSGVSHDFDPPDASKIQNTPIKDAP